MADPLNIRIGRNTNAGTEVDLDTDRVLPGCWWAVTHVSVVNTSGENVHVAFELLTGSEVDHIWVAFTVAASAAIGIMVGWTVGEGQQLRAACTGIANSGPVEFIVMGRKEYLEVD